TERIDERADVFGLGAILCEILTGQPPYVAVKSGEIYQQAFHGDLSAALARLDGCGAEPELIALAKSSLASFEERPRHAGLLAESITAYLASVEQRLRAAEVANAEAKVRAAQERRVRRRTVALVTAVLVAVLVGGGTALWLKQEQDARDAAADKEAQQTEE